MTGKMRHAAGGLLAAVMTLSLTFSHGVPVVYADGENITVASVEELEELAKNCKLDTWSQGKTVTWAVLLPNTSPSVSLSWQV